MTEINPPEASPQVLPHDLYKPLSESRVDFFRIPELFPAYHLALQNLVTIDTEGTFKSISLNQKLLDQLEGGETAEAMQVFTEDMPRISEDIAKEFDDDVHVMPFDQLLYTLQKGEKTHEYLGQQWLMMDRVLTQLALEYYFKYVQPHQVDVQKQDLLEKYGISDATRTMMEAWFEEIPAHQLFMFGTSEKIQEDWQLTNLASTRAERLPEEIEKAIQDVLKPGESDSILHRLGLGNQEEVARGLETAMTDYVVARAMGQSVFGAITSTGEDIHGVDPIRRDYVAVEGARFKGGYKLHIAGNHDGNLIPLLQTVGEIVNSNVFTWKVERAKHASTVAQDKFITIYPSTNNRDLSDSGLILRLAKEIDTALSTAELGLETPVVAHTDLGLGNSKRLSMRYDRMNSVGDEREKSFLDNLPDQSSMTSEIQQQADALGLAVNW